MDETSKYQLMDFIVAHIPGNFMPTVRLSVCNLCGSVVGNRPAHDMFCFSTEGEIKENDD